MTTYSSTTTRIFIPLLLWVFVLLLSPVFGPVSLVPYGQFMPYTSMRFLCYVRACLVAILTTGMIHLSSINVLYLKIDYQLSGSS